MIQVLQRTKDKPCLTWPVPTCALVGFQTVAPPRLDKTLAVLGHPAAVVGAAAGAVEAAAILASRLPPARRHAQVGLPTREIR